MARMVGSTGNDAIALVLSSNKTASSSAPSDNNALAVSINVSTSSFSCCAYES